MLCSNEPPGEDDDAASRRAGLEHVTPVPSELPALVRKTGRPMGQPETGHGPWASLPCAGVALSSLAQRGGADARKASVGCRKPLKLTSALHWLCLWDRAGGPLMFGQRGCVA